MDAKVSIISSRVQCGITAAMNSVMVRRIELANSASSTWHESLMIDLEKKSDLFWKSLKSLIKVEIIVIKQKRLTKWGQDKTADFK